MIEDTYNQLAQDIITKFRNFCKEKEWTQLEASHRIYCDPSHLSKIFSGKRNPSIKTLQKMEEVMENDGE